MSTYIDQYEFITLLFCRYFDKYFKMAPKTCKFVDGERILCFHGPLMYEAKCIKSELREGNKGFYYLIHYNGWNKHWDEWVPESRVLKYSDSNLQKQKELQKQHGKDKSKRSKPGRFLKPDNGKETVEKVRKNEIVASSGEPRKKRSRLEPTVEDEDSYVAKVEVRVTIPDELKSTLIDDWDLITRQKRLYSLPAKITIDEILSSYVDKHGCLETKSCAQELTGGIKDYFNAMLGSQLLYRFERSQYNEIFSQHQSKSATTLYGFPHLLRLFVNVGSILTYTKLDEDNMSILIKNMQSFLDYLQENLTSLFNASEYEPATAEYQKKTTT